MTELRYRELRIPELADRIECVWFMQASDPPTATAERVLPDGCVEIVFNLADPFEHLATAGAPRGSRSGPGARLQPRRLVVGPFTRSLSIRPTGAIDLVGIRVCPGAWPTLFRSPVVELRDDWAGLDTLEPRADLDLLETLGNAVSSAERVASLHATLLGAKARRCALDHRVRGAVRLIRSTAGSISIEEVARRSGASQRTLERLFARDVGMAPKVLARIVRLHRALRHLQSNDSSELRGALFDAGYFDQSHFLRDFRAIVGVAPSTFLTVESNPMSDAFTADSRTSE